MLAYRQGAAAALEDLGLEKQAFLPALAAGTALRSGIGWAARGIAGAARNYGGFLRGAAANPLAHAKAHAGSMAVSGALNGIGAKANGASMGQTVASTAKGAVTGALGGPGHIVNALTS